MDNIVYVLHSAFDQAADLLFILNFSNNQVKLLAIPAGKFAHCSNKVPGFRGGTEMSASTLKALK